MILSARLVNFPLIRIFPLAEQTQSRTVCVHRLLLRVVISSTLLSPSVRFTFKGIFQTRRLVVWLATGILSMCNHIGIVVFSFPFSCIYIALWEHPQWRYGVFYHYETIWCRLGWPKGRRAISTCGKCSTNVSIPFSTNRKKDMVAGYAFLWLWQPSPGAGTSGVWYSNSKHWDMCSLSLEDWRDHFYHVCCLAFGFEQMINSLYSLYSSHKAVLAELIEEARTHYLQASVSRVILHMTDGVCFPHHHIQVQNSLSSLPSFRGSKR